MPKKKMDKDFSKAFAELDETAAWFERGELDVEEGLKRFASAMETATTLKAYLQEAQNRVNEIRASNAIEIDNTEEEEDEK
jgi:exodeoxyribonuclease VII small subunit